MLMVPQLIWSFNGNFPKFKVCLFFRLEQFSSNMFCNNSPLLILYFHIRFVFISRYALKSACNFSKINLFYDCCILVAKK